jgi:putative ABC transport system permease protein
MSPGPLRRIPFLASAHLLHEWVLTLCLVLALAAVLAPLLVLFGLKHGTIHTLRERLVEDPVFREIRPTRTREFSPEWFDALAARDGVGFLTPTILPLSSVVSVVTPGPSGNELFDLIPTAPDDPLILENGGVVPGEGEVVLTAEAARLAGAKTGGGITVRVTRSRGGRSEAVEVALRVAAVLDRRAGSLARVYAPLPFVLDVEGYKEGYAAPERGWAGDTPVPYPSYDGALLLLPSPLPPIVRSGLVINTGFARLADATPPRVREVLGLAPPEGLTCYELFTPGSPVTASSLRAVDRKLRGHSRVLLPYADDIVLEAGDRALRPVGLSLDGDQAALLGVVPTPWGGFDGSLSAQSATDCLWPGAENPGAVVDVRAAGLRDVAFPLRPAGTTSLDRPVIPAGLLGVLRTARARAVTFDPRTGGFRMARGGYRGFRLYASSIDDVPGLFRYLQDQGVEVAAEVEAIERIRILDGGLSRLFRLIALLGLFGGTGVLVASLYAAVERRRRDLGVLRLLGFSRRHVFFFPMVQGLVIATLGFLAGLGGYGVLARVINRSFAMDLAPGEAFCVLPGGYVPVFLLSTLALASVASLAAAWRATCIDPAEVIREQ